MSPSAAYREGRTNWSDPEGTNLTNEPDLPILLSTFGRRRKKIKLLKLKLSNKKTRYVHIDPPSRGWGEKERRLWDQKYRELNPEHYLYDKEITELQKLISKRERKVLCRLREIFNQFECPYIDWESLALKLMETPTYRSAGPVPPHKLRRIKGRSSDDWRSLALQLTLVNELFTVEPFKTKRADRTAEMKLNITLMIEACLAPNPETGRAFSPSVAQAAESVYAKLIRMAKAGNSTPEEIKEIPSASYIRTLYYRFKNSMEEEEEPVEEEEDPMKEKENSMEEEEDSVIRGDQFDRSIVCLSSRMQQKIRMDQVLSDLEGIATLWEYAMKAEND